MSELDYKKLLKEICLAALSENVHDRTKHCSSVLAKVKDLYEENRKLDHLCSDVMDRTAAVSKTYVESQENYIKLMEAAIQMLKNEKDFIEVSV